MTKNDPELAAAALAAALAEERDRSRAVERHLWETAKYFVSLGLPLSTALRVLGVSRATWYRKTAEWRRQ